MACVQIDVASVLKLSGARISVAGNSFIIRIKTKINAPVIPGVIDGMLIFCHILKFDAPKLFADSSSFGFICDITGLIIPIATGMNKIIYPIDNKIIV